MKSEKTIEYTVNITSANYEKLKALVDEKEIASINEGIDLGIEMLIKEKRREMYKRKMEEAAKDIGFMNRTTSVSREFEKTDAGNTFMTGSRSDDN